ncbi:MAG: hypothetical protein JWR32_3281 [Mycobacterium sp.]|nr:hypothetical protein [Mycobacterium sp.]
MFLEAVWFPASSPCGPVAAASGEAFRNWTAAFASIATVLAVLSGGVWAYYKFIRSRTFHPQVSVEILGQWRNTDEDHAYPWRLGFRLHRPKANVLHVRVRVRNIGAAKVTLNQPGTGLRVSFPSAPKPLPPYSFGWKYDPAQDSEDLVIEVLKKVNWIEPGETASDDVLLDLGRSPTLAMLELRLVWSRSHSRLFRWICRRKNVVDFARRIIPPDSVMIDKV